MILFETLRLTVRQLQPEDVDAMFAIYGDPEVVRWVDDGQPLSRDLCAKWIDVSQHNYTSKGFGVSAVIEKATGTFIGCCGIIYAPGGSEPEIIYAFRPSHWGQGFASEVVPAMLAYGFDTCHLPDIYATIFPENLASARVLTKAGMSWLRDDFNEDGTTTAVYVQVQRR
ncbi:MAG: GNAT family N-acetyltransferase [Chloroflexi bacterium]|nr:GNAT family N-acetyltransferase [Chloroflexota bacterium]